MNRDLFDMPPGTYLCGHSLGPMPRGLPDAIAEELDAWRSLGVAAHFRAARPWYHYQEQLRGPLARLVGARPDEVVAMNGLTVNLHLLLATFYRPTPKRHCIVIDEPTFPSDRYAVATHMQHRGHAPGGGLLVVSSLDELDWLLSRRNDIALALLAGVNFLTGEVLDVRRAAEVCRRHDIPLGLDLAHAAGNVPLALHDDGVDFAVWCSYKYLNAGPGAVAGCFVHQRHGDDTTLPRLGGWWGNDPATRFRMHLQPDFVPRTGADGWQLSNPPILALAPLRLSLEMFDRVGMPALREQSIRLVDHLLERLPPGVELLSPRDPARRSSMVCLRLRDRPEEKQKALEAAGVVCDFRPPDVIRAALCPLYNTEEDAQRLAQALANGG